MRQLNRTPPGPSSIPSRPASPHRDGRLVVAVLTGLAKGLTSLK